MVDSKDSEIIRLVQTNGKLSYAEIGEQVGLSITAVKERIKKMVNSGILRDNVYIPDPDLLGFDICAFVQVLMPVPAEEANFAKTINEVDEVQECHFITGEYSYLLKIRVRNTKALERVLGEKIKTIPGVVRTNTIMSLTTSKETLRLSL
ncbi:Lrp/AsnC family transcriptional regulator [Aureisphaera galaxeae]|uniref:Lrp/AsnC family transcriptional regulator n=1 Tax=Aureisphaera galaxeae TaxID=1538023 RepID=UPI00235046A5|nr:Lrp/AsnC family transcriptional regulator [Aureisphaera galaxeae]MDC8003669.1 Lrp/AsnC family transcriptional regulator [Aureisphaera galaxeae]